jgi:acyl-CoA thioester hydrolase
MNNLPKLQDFPAQDYDKLRYSDMDTQGHINNAVFTTLFETGRASLLGQPSINAWNNQQYAYVLARLEVDYHAELRWPGIVHVGTAVKSIGRTSLVLAQSLFKDDTCVASALNVMVQIGKTSHRPEPFTDEIRAVLSSLMLKNGSQQPSE